MIERVITFGRRAEQVGILCSPSGDQSFRERPVVLMWNVGVNHRVGPFRVYVDLSRRLADLGFAAFRFDSSGLGDSEIRRDAVSDAQREDMDVTDAIDAVVKRTEIRRVILVGFCSSIDAAHRVSVKDPRVVGVIHVEGYAFESPGFKKRRYERLLSWPRWHRLLKTQATKLEARLKNRAPEGLPSEPVFKRDYPAWPAFSADLVTLSKRGVSLLFAYCGGDTLYNHSEQFWEMFATPQLDRSKIDVEYYPDADHTFFSVESRKVLTDRIMRWLHVNFPARQASTESLAAHS